MSTHREMGHAQVREHERIRSLGPKESDFKGRKGYERYHVVEVGGERVKVQGEAPDGTYQWAYHFKPNDGHGRGTREFHEVCEMLAPFTRADEARRHGAPAGPALADQTEGRNGRSRVRLAGGNRVERGTRWCLTTPHPWTRVPEGGNPDGSWA